MKVNMLEIKTCHSIVTADMPAHRPYFIKDSIWPQEKIKNTAMEEIIFLSVLSLIKQINT